MSSVESSSSKSNDKLAIIAEERYALGLGGTMDRARSLKWTSSPQPTHWRVAAVQIKFARMIEENVAAIDAAVRQAARRRADVVLFPECAVTGYGYDLRR